MKHTPGPWRLGMKPGPMIYGPQGEQVANMHVAMLEQPEHIANAQLIAAAPMLAEALKELIEIRHKCFIPDPDDNWTTRARAALAAAGVVS